MPRSLPYRSSLLAALSVIALSGCLEDWFTLPDEPDPATAQKPPTLFPQCKGVREEIDYARLAAAEFTREPAPGESFEEEVPISPLGCVRYMHRVEDGKETRRAMVVARGAIEAFMLPGDVGVGFREMELFITREDITSTSNRLEVDRDQDGFPETVMAGAYDEQGLVEEVITDTNAGSGQLTRRRTLKRIDGDTIRWTEEARLNGELVIVRDQVAPSVMEAGLEGMGDCYHPGQNYAVRCSSDDTRAITQALLDMLPKAADCLTKKKLKSELNEEERELIAHLVKTRAGKIVRTCFEGSTSVASIQHVGSDPWGTHLLNVNVAMFRCQSPNYIQATMLHEILHILRGPHAAQDSTLYKLRGEGDLDDLSYIYTDSIRACEEYCFGEIKTKCSCAACLQTLACDPACEREASCTVEAPGGGYTMSEAVGALCTPADRQAKPTWHKTMAACGSSCKGGSCKSYSLSCDKNCN